MSSGNLTEKNDVPATASAHPFHFPFPPYDIQLDFMKKLFETLERGHIGIFESPTGTGKSLSVICGSLSWLWQHQPSSLASAAAVVPRQDTPVVIINVVNSNNPPKEEPDWLRNYSSNTHPGKSTNDVCTEEETKVSAQSQEAPISSAHIHTTLSPTAVWPRLCRPASTDVAASHLSRFKKSRTQSTTTKRTDTSPRASAHANLAANDERVQIIFCSRTHSQLSQFVNEIKKTTFGSSLRCVTLGSRKSLCNHSAVQRLSSDLQRREKCLDLNAAENKKTGGCPYSVPTDQMDLFRDHAHAKLRDIEELAALGKELHSCSYYGVRSSIPSAQLIAMPYSMLLNKKTRESVGISLHNNIVILDEAHNLIEAINQSHSCMLSFQEIVDNSNQVKNYTNKYQHRFKSQNRVYLRQIQSVFQLLQKFLLTQQQSSASSASKVWDITDFLFEAKLDHLNLFHLNLFIDQHKLHQKLMGFQESQDKENTSSPSPKTSSLYKIQAFLQSLTNSAVDGRVLVHQAKDQDPLGLKFILLNPAVHFQEIVQQARSIILTGGTMQPTDDLIQQLFSQVPRDQIQLLSCNHVIPARNLLTVSLPRGPSGRSSFDFTFKHRNQHEMIDELGRTICNLCNIIPDGMVCFFPSYSYEKQVIERWQETGELQKIQRKKSMFREPKEATDLDQMFRKYSQAIHQPSPEEDHDQVRESSNIPTSHNGAILFCVVGGKMSEGINFSDRLARGVVMVGLPYSNPSELELAEKMRYLDQTLPEGAGNNFYEGLCMKAVNQSIGRSIRHRNDYACIILIDQRYARSHVIQRLPTWISSGLVTAPSFGKMYASVNNFFKQLKVTAVAGSSNIVEAASTSTTPPL